MKKVKILFIINLLVAMLFFLITSVEATEIEEGTPGNKIHGEYVVIVNTNKDYKATQSTGTINFDSGTQEITKTQSFFDAKSNYSSLPKQQSINMNRATTKYQIGDKKTFYQGKEYICIGEGQYCYIWMENNLKAEYDLAGKTEKAAKDMMSVYDARPYEALNTLSNNNIIYKDNSGKLSILLEEMTTSAGFFAGESDITAIHIKAKKPSLYTEGDFLSTNGLIVHEGQHALFLHHTCKDNSIASRNLSWLNEALAVASMDWYWGGDDPSGWLDMIPKSQSIRNGSAIFYDTYSNDNSKDYSLPYLFIRYLINQTSQGYNPVQFIQNVYKIDATGKDNEAILNEILTINGIQGNYETVIKNFYTAIVAQQKTGIYGFYGDPIIWNKIKEYPLYSGQSGESIELFGTSAIVVKTLNGEFNVPLDGGSDIKYIAVNKTKELLKPSIGEGTQESPYIIKTEKELNSLSEYPNAHFKLGNDITIDKTTYFTVKNFLGTIDGNGYTIYNLKQPLVYNNIGIIKNLNISANVDSEFNTYYGTIAVINQKTITDCSVIGNINLTITGTNKMLENQIGGIVGKNEVAGRIERSYINANINVILPANNVSLGAVIGSNNGTITDSYSSGTLNVIQNNNEEYKLKVGGTVGEIDYKSSTLGLLLEKIYTTVDVKVNANGDKLQKLIGLFAGNINTNITNSNINSIYVLEQNNQNATGNNYINSGINLKTDLEMKAKDTFKEFNFDGIWEIKSGEYPKFVASDTLIITVNNSKTNYYIGEKIEPYYVKIDVNGAQVSLTEDMLNTYDTSTVGLKTIVGEYRNKSFSFQVDIKAPTTVTNLEIEKYPKLTYIENEMFDSSGLVLIATIDGNMYRRIYSGYTYDKTNPLKVEDNTITFTYANATVTSALTVREKVAKELVVLKAPSKVNYYTGEKLDLKELILQIVYTDGTKSPSFNLNELSKYDINLAKSSGKNLIPISADETISINDNNLNIYAFMGDVNEYNTVNKRITTIKVTNAMSLGNQNIILTQNKDNYEFTDNILGGSGNFEVSLKSGIKPQGISISFTGNVFRIQGRPMQIQDTKLLYEIKDTLTGQIIQVELNISVQPVSKEANFYTFTLLKSWNPHLENDINGVINENEVLLYVPNGTDITALKISHTESRGATLPMHQWNGSTINFTNPVKFIITAEDGITTKEYNVRVIMQEKPTEIKIDIRNYKVDNNKISYIGQRVTIEQFLSNITVSENLNVEVETVNANQEFIGTNTKIRIKQGNLVIREYVCIVYGDINGDGKITSMDYTLIKNHIMDVKKITDINMQLVADVNGDNKITSMDYTLIKNDIMDIKKIPLK